MAAYDPGEVVGLLGGAGPLHGQGGQQPRGAEGQGAHLADVFNMVTLSQD